MMSERMRKLFPQLWNPRREYAELELNRELRKTIREAIIAAVDGPHPTQLNPDGLKCGE